MDQFRNNNSKFRKNHSIKNRRISLTTQINSNRSTLLSNNYNKINRRRIKDLVKEEELMMRININETNPSQ